MHQVATDPTLVTSWLTTADDRLQVVDTRSAHQTHTAGPAASGALCLAQATPSQVRWETWWDNRFGGSNTLDLVRSQHGTLVRLTREIVTFGKLAAIVMPAARLANSLGMPTTIQNLSFACADQPEQERS